MAQKQLLLLAFVSLALFTTWGCTPAAENAKGDTDKPVVPKNKTGPVALKLAKRIPAVASQGESYVYYVMRGGETAHVLESYHKLELTADNKWIPLLRGSKLGVYSVDDNQLDLHIDFGEGPELSIPKVAPKKNLITFTATDQENYTTAAKLIVHNPQTRIHNDCDVRAFEGCGSRCTAAEPAWNPTGNMVAIMEHAYGPSAGDPSIAIFDDQCKRLSTTPVIEKSKCKTEVCCTINAWTPDGVQYTCQGQPSVLPSGK